MPPSSVHTSPEHRNLIGRVVNAQRIASGESDTVSARQLSGKKSNPVSSVQFKNAFGLLTDKTALSKQEEECGERHELAAPRKRYTTYEVVHKS